LICLNIHTCTRALRPSCSCVYFRQITRAHVITITYMLQLYKEQSPILHFIRFQPYLYTVYVYTKEQCKQHLLHQSSHYGKIRVNSIINIKIGQQAICTINCKLTPCTVIKRKRDTKEDKSVVSVSLSICSSVSWLVGHRLFG